MCPALTRRWHEGSEPKRRSQGTESKATVLPSSGPPVTVSVGFTLDSRPRNREPDPAGRRRSRPWSNLREASGGGGIDHTVRNVSTPDLRGGVAKWAGSGPVGS